MKGLILAGGTGSRMFPCTRVTNKHLLPVYNKPMIYYPLQTMKSAGVREVMIVSGPGHAGHFLNLLGSGKEFGLDLSYDIQEEAGGIAQALNVGKTFIGDDSCVIILGDNIFEDNIGKFAEKFRKQKKGARIFLKKVPMEDARRFGCALVKGDKVIYAEEKPERPRSNLAMVGLYMFDSTVFDKIKKLTPSARGEYEIVDVIKMYIEEGNCYYDMIEGFWSDAGTFESLHYSSDFIREKETGNAKIDFTNRNPAFSPEKELPNFEMKNSSFEGNVKISFQKVKEDIENIRKSLENLRDTEVKKKALELNGNSEEIYVSKPFVNEEILDSIIEVLNSGRFTAGPKLEEFEKKFSEFTGAKYAIALANGTVAIEVVLRSLGIGKGDEVIVPSYTTMPSIEPIINVGATPVFADVEKETYTLDPEKVKKAISRKTKAVMPVHIYGHPAKISELAKICKEKKIHLIEDCAQAHNSRYKGKHVGTFGTAGCFSFYPTKNLTVLGEGGMIITNSKKLYEYAKMLVDHGQKGRYNHLIAGTNYRLGEIACAIGIKQLELLNSFTERRREIAEIYRTNLQDTEIILPKEEGYANHCYHLFVVRVDKNKREDIIKMLKQNKINAGIHYPVPCHMQKAVKEIIKKKYKLPATESLCKEIISLPIYPELTDEKVKEIAEKVKYACSI